MRIIERKDAKYLLFGILEISEKKRENHSNSEKKHFERKEASQMCLASFHIKRDTEKSISANLGIFLPRQCPCSRTTVLKNTRRRRSFLSLSVKILLRAEFPPDLHCAFVLHPGGKVGEIPFHDAELQLVVGAHIFPLAEFVDPFIVGHPVR